MIRAQCAVIRGVKKATQTTAAKVELLYQQLPETQVTDYSYFTNYNW